MELLTIDGALHIWVPMQEALQTGSSRKRRNSSASPVLLYNKASRFAKVYPAGTLSLPQGSFTNDYTTPTSKKMT